MGIILRIARGFALTWAFLGLVAFALAVSASGKALFAAWAKSLAWIVGVQLYPTGGETPEGMGLLLANSLGQMIFYFGGVLLFLIVRKRKSAPPSDYAPLTPHAGV